MHSSRPALLLCSLFLCGCENPDASTASAESSPRESGAIAFQLPSDDLGRATGTADSLRLELVRGDIKRSVTAPWNQPLCLDGLEPGSWSAQLGLYKANGQMTWLGMDSLKVFEGEVVPLSIPLRSARGTVDSILHPQGVLAAETRLFAEPWMLHQLGQTAIVGANAELRLTDSGAFYGLFPCGMSKGTFRADSSTLSFSGLPSSNATCTGERDTALGRSLLAALAATRRWTISQGHLSLRDSTGAFLARFETYLPRGRSRASVDTLTIAPSLDSTGLHIGLARIESIPLVTDSVILVDLQLPRRGSEVRLVSLPAGDRAPACGTRSWPAPDLKRILVVETSDPSLLYATAMDQVQIAIRWRDLPRRVRLEDRSGRSIEVERP
ncbi:MAG: META domain-containing protein [Fibrobacterota bacterium]|nr:META domain-containing protein [Fibrobacterota bacterium]QQS05792.1 MAG: META domain-containing protein [Fibrobacterota bacterium]